MSRNRCCQWPRVFDQGRHDAPGLWGHGRTRHEMVRSRLKLDPCRGNKNVDDTLCSRVLKSTAPDGIEAFGPDDSRRRTDRCVWATGHERAAPPEIEKACPSPSCPILTSRRPRRIRMAGENASCGRRQGRCCAARTSQNGRKHQRAKIDVRVEARVRAFLVPAPVAPRDAPKWLRDPWRNREEASWPVFL